METQRRVPNPKFGCRDPQLPRIDAYVFCVRRWLLYK